MRLMVWSESAIFGGHERMVCSLMEGLINVHGVDVRWRVHPENTHFIQAIPSHTPCHRLPIPRLPDRIIRGLIGEYRSALWRAIDEERPDVIVTIPGWPTCSATPLFHQKRIPVVVYVPNGPRGGGMVSAIKRRVSGYVLNQADMVVTCAEAVALHLRGYTGTPVEVVENFVEPPAAMALSSLHRLLPAIGMVGRIDTSVKGHDVLLRALKHDPGFGGLATWHIFGSGPDEQAIRAECQNLPGGIQFTCHGWQSSQVAYAGLDAVLMPSRLEGAPLSAIEACLRQLPVIGSDIPELAPYVLPGNAFAVDDAGGLTAAVRNWLSLRGSPTLQRNLAELAEITLRRHDRSKSVAKFHELVTTVVKRCALAG